MDHFSFLHIGDDATCHGTGNLFGKDHPVLGSFNYNVGVFVFVARFGKVGSMEVSIYVGEMYYLSRHGHPVGVGVEKRHEDGDFYSFVVPKLLFNPLLDGNDPSVGRGIYQTVQITFVGAFGLSVKVERHGKQEQRQSENNGREDRIGQEDEGNKIDEQERNKYSCQRRFALFVYLKYFSH